MREAPFLAFSGAGSDAGARIHADCAVRCQPESHIWNTPSDDAVATKGHYETQCLRRRLFPDGREQQGDFATFGARLN